MKKKMSDCSECYPDDCSKCPEKQESAPQKIAKYMTCECGRMLIERKTKLYVDGRINRMDKHMKKEIKQAREEVLKREKRESDEIIEKADRIIKNLEEDKESLLNELKRLQNDTFIRMNPKDMGEFREWIKEKRLRGRKE